MIFAKFKASEFSKITKVLQSALDFSDISKNSLNK